MNKMIETFKMLKKKHSDALILFRVGDFYESYCEDAQKASEVLGVTLTKNKKEDIFMAGFPTHALDTYLPKLIRAGVRVAICDNIDNAQNTKEVAKETPQDEYVEYEEIKTEEPTETKSAKIIYTDKEAEDYTPKNGKTFGKTEMCGIVEGYIDIIRLNDGRAIIVDSQGKALNKAVNIPATNILRRDHFTTDYIVGTAIVCDVDMIE